MLPQSVAVGEDTEDSGHGANRPRKECIMDEKAREELFSRLNAININIDEPMTLEQLQFFVKGYECCRDSAYLVIEDTYQHRNKPPRCD